MKRVFRFLWRFVLPVSMTAALLLYSLFVGRVWFLEVAACIPPNAFLLLPILCIVIALVGRHWMYGVCGLMMMVLAVPLTDLWGLTTLNRTEMSENAASITVFSMNTAFWESDPQSEASMVQFIHQQQADVILLQENWTTSLGQLRNADDIQLLFPEYYVSTSQDLITLSRFPMEYTQPGRVWLRTDIRVRDALITVFNIHTTSPYTLRKIHQPRAFFADMHERFSIRAKQFEELSAVLAVASHPLIAVGDYNTTRSMGILNKLFHRYQDAGASRITLLPGSWSPNMLTLWRIDFALLSPDIRVRSYKQVNVDAFSDHRAMLMQVSLP